MEQLKKQLEDIKNTLPLMIKLGAIDQSAYKTLNEALTEALQQYAVMQRSEQLVAFVEWLEANSDHSIDRGWIDEYIEATNCA
jgi:hypothetical protein